MKSILDDSFDARFEHSSPRQSWTWEVYCFSTMLSGEKLKSKTINSFCTENLKKVSSIWFSWEIKSLNMVSIENVNNLMRQHDNNFSRIPSSNGTTFRIKVALHASCWLFVDCRFFVVTMFWKYLLQNRFSSTPNMFWHKLTALIKWPLKATNRLSWKDHTLRIGLPKRIVPLFSFLSRWHRETANLWRLAKYLVLWSLCNEAYLWGFFRLTLGLNYNFILSWTHLKL